MRFKSRPGVQTASGTLQGVEGIQFHPGTARQQRKFLACLLVTTLLVVALARNKNSDNEYLLSTYYVQALF